MNDYSSQDDCYYKKYGLNMDSCSNNNINKEFSNEFCDKFTNYNPSVNNPNSCTSLQAPTYTFPISDDAKKKYDEALNTSLNNTTANQISYDDFNKQSNIKSVQPYYDDDLEQYLNINNFKNAINYPPINNSSNISTPISSQLPISNNNKINITYDDIINTNNDTNNNTKQYTNVNNNDLLLPKKSDTDIKSKKEIFYKNIINIGLFVFIGIVIILLCDQITEIAINIGMKRTMQMLEPYLQKIQELKNIQLPLPPLQTPQTL